MIGANGKTVTIRGFVVLPVSICGVLLWHEFAVACGMQPQMIIGADILQPHFARLAYEDNGEVQLEFKKEECAECRRNKALPQEGEAAQMRYVSRKIRATRNRQQVDDGFIAEHSTEW